MRVPKLLLVFFVVVVCGAACPACGDDHVTRGDRLARERRWKEAVEEYQRAIARYPHDYAAAWGIARVYCHGVHLPDKCLAWTDRLRAAYPDRADYRAAAAQGWRDRAAALDAMGDAAGASEARRQADLLR